MHHSQKRKKLTCYIAILGLPWLAYFITAVLEQYFRITPPFFTVAALVAVSAGQLLALHRIRNIRLPKSWPSDFGFSSREIEVADLIVAGFTNAQIANALFISMSTVKSHVHNVMRKADINSRWELIKFVIPSSVRFNPKDDSRISDSY